MPAPGGWFLCNVVSAGPDETGSVNVRLTDSGGTFNTRWFGAVATAKREMLATALVAMTSGFRVDALLVSTDEYSQLDRLYIRSN
jgi:hypothetical protein